MVVIHFGSPFDASFARTLKNLTVSAIDIIFDPLKEQI
jgi:hypothetical protein